jgi:hypothetical protein
LAALSQRRLSCARCGNDFTCGAGGRDGRCWCADEEYRLPMPATTDQDCLCPSCLRVHAKQSGMDLRR